MRWNVENNDANIQTQIQTSTMLQKWKAGVEGAMQVPQLSQTTYVKTKSEAKAGKLSNWNLLVDHAK